MLKFRESLVSSHHNYVLNQMLTPGFVVGNPDLKEGFFFLADVVQPGESGSRIYCRIYDSQGNFVLEAEPDRIVTNPLGCLRQPLSGGYRMVLPSGEPLLSVQTESFANGSLTRIQGKLYDRAGKLRMEPHFDAVLVHGESVLWLKDPFRKR